MGGPEDLGYRPGRMKDRKDMNSTEKAVDTATNITMNTVSYTAQGFVYAMWIGGAISLLLLIVFGAAMLFGM